MSLAEEMLANMSVSDDSASYLTGQEGHIVINESRTAIVPAELKTIAVTGDKDIETVTFDCVRYWDGNDLSTFAIYLNYVLPDKTVGTYIPEAITTSEGEGVFHFDWKIKNNITTKSGKISFAITAIKTKQNENGETVVDKQWGSLPNGDCSIALGLDITNVPSEEESSGVVAQLSAILEKIQSDVDEWIKTVLVQEPGNSTTKAMSQKVVTDTFFEILKTHTDANNPYSIMDNIALEQGTLYEGVKYNNDSRVRSGFLIVNKNTRIVAKDGYEVSVHFYDWKLNYVRYSVLGYANSKAVIFGESGIVRLVFAKADGSSITVDEARENFSIYTKDPITYNTFDIPFAFGNYSMNTANGGATISNTQTRILSEIVRIPKNTLLTSTEKFYLYVYDYDTNINTCTGIGWTSEYYTENEILVRIVMAYKNDSNIADINALKSTLNMIVVTPSTVADLDKPIIIKTIPCDIVGTLYDGKHYSGPTTRAHTDFIKVEKGMVLCIDGYKYAVHYYADATEGSHYKNNAWYSSNIYRIEEDCYIRVVCSHFFDTPEMTSSEAVVKLGWSKPTRTINRPFGIVAHRGFHKTEAENSLGAFKAAASEGFKYIETDVHWTSDELPVINHDSTYDNVAISSLTLAEWQARGLCSLVDFLKVCKVNSITPLIEFKSSLTDERAEYLYNMLVDMGMLNTMFVAFNKTNLMYMLNKYPFDVILAKDYGAVPTKSDLDEYKELFHCGNNVYWVMFGEDFDESYYETFRNSGVKIIYTAANNSETFYEWVSYCDMIFTDTVAPPIA